MRGVSLAVAATALGAAPVVAQSAAEYDYPIEVSSIGLPAPSPPGLPNRSYQVTPTQVPLAGAGRLEFAPLPSALGLDHWNWPMPAKTSLQVWFDGSGAPLKCDAWQVDYGWIADARERLDGWDWSAHSQAICTEFLRSARFTRASWFALPVERGFLDIEVSLSRRVVPELPVRLIDRTSGSGIPLTIRYEDDGLQCTASAQRVGPSDGEAVCAAFLQSAEAERLRTVRRGPASPRRADLVAYVAAVAEPVAQGRVEVAVEPERPFFEPAYPANDVPETLRLPADEGHVEIELYKDDNPLRWRSHRSERSIRMLIGVTAAGAIETCRPLSSSGIALLDNSTCELLVRKGRFVFRDAQSYTDLRYTVQGLRWGPP